MPVATVFKANDIFRKACGYLSQPVEDSEDFKQFSPDWMDALLVEALPYENAKRRLEADPTRPPLQVAPVVEDLETVVPYDDEICRVALPYGLASQYFIDDGDNYNAQDFRARFISALNAALQTEEESVRDVYP